MFAPLWLIPYMLMISSTALADDGEDLFVRALGSIEEQYLYLEDFDPGEALYLAAEAAEDAVSWLIVERDSAQDVVILLHGEVGEIGRLSLAVDTIEDMLPALMTMEQVIRTTPNHIQEDIDLRVELLRGVSRALDRHSVVMHRQRLDRFNERIKGKLTGIGAQVTLQDGAPVISDVFPDSPARAGDLRLGDVIRQIDGASTVGLSVDEVVSRIRGVEGSTVVLGIAREDTLLEVALIRAEVRIPNVKWSYRDDGVGILKITTFSEQTAYFLQHGLEVLAASGDLTGLIIDLRGNTGGMMRQACYSVDQFLTTGTVLRTEGRNGAEVRGLMRRFPARLDGDEPEVPVLILVDDRTASASEILAGCLMLSERAVLIGERTLGKGTVQRREVLRSGEDGPVELKLTVAEYRLTSERVPILSDVGLEPDLWVRPVIFSRGGVSIRSEARGGRTTPLVLYADERPGWRNGIALADTDALVELSARILRAMPTDSLDRGAMLDTIATMLPQIRQDLDQEVQQTFAYRGLDWSASSDEAVDPSLLDVSVYVVDTPTAGEAVEVRAVVQNNGPVPLHRVYVRLDAERGLPWDGLTLPIGKVEPGEPSLGSAMVFLPAESPSRIDQVMPTLHVDRAAERALPPISLGIDGHPALSLSVAARMEPMPDGQHRLHVNLQNHSTITLQDLSAKLSLPSGSPIELAEDGIQPGDLPANGTCPFAFSMTLAELGLDEVISLQVDAAAWGRVLDVPLDLIETGEDAVAPPSVRAALPTEAPVGTMQVTVDAQDDQQLVSLTAWWDTEKVAWSGGGDAEDAFLLSLDIQNTHHTLLVEAIDNQGARTRRSFHVQGLEDTGGAVDAGEDVPPN